MSKLGLGTAAIGRPQYINIRQEDTSSSFDMDIFRAKGVEVLEEAYKSGVRYFDTAPGYGMAEELLIDWVTQKNDPSIEVATKWGYTYTANFDPNATQHEVKEHSLSKLNEQWVVSQKLFPYLSTYQIHSATFDSGVLENEEVLERLASLKTEHNLWMGLTTSGDNQAEVLKKALDINLGGMPLFDVFQVTYNVMDQSLAEIASKITAANKRLVIKEAMANGRVFPNQDYPHYKPIYDNLKDLAKKYAVGIDAIALRFCMDSIEPHVVLSGASSPEQLKENMRASGIMLEKDEIEHLKSLAVDPEAYWKERKNLDWS